MSDFTFNAAKGRVTELCNRVNDNDPATSGLVVVPVDRGAVTDATLKDLDTLAAVLASVTERTTGGWNRKTLTALTVTTDDVNDRTACDFADQTWTAVTAGTVTDLVICYAPDTAGADSTLIPLTCQAFAITPDGSDVVAEVSDFFRAS